MNVRLGLIPEKDLWIQYFTRSNKVAALIEEYGVESFNVEIRRTFDTIKQARDWETKVLRRMKVLKKPNIWLNRTDNKAILNEVHPRGTLGKTWKHPNPSCGKPGNKYTSGKYWCHKGKQRKMLSIGTPIPEGFILGTGRKNKRPDLSRLNKQRIWTEEMRKKVGARFNKEEAKAK